jgi:kynurenine formamidase
MEANGWIDVSVSLHSDMVHWPDNPPVRIQRALNIEHGDVANVSEISMGAHTGTHMDGPIHFVREGKGLDELPFTATIGGARAIAMMRHGFGGHPYGPSEAEVRERREGRIGSFLREYAEAPHS